MVDVQFQDPTKKMPYVRNAMLLANLTCPQAKIEDGVAKLLKPADVSRAGGKSMMGRLNCASPP